MAGRCCIFFSTNELIAESSFHEIHVTSSFIDTFFTAFGSVSSDTGEPWHISISGVVLKKRSVSLLITSNSSTIVIDAGLEQLEVISEWNFSGEPTDDCFEWEDSWCTDDCVCARGEAGIAERVVISVAVEWLISVRIVEFSSVTGNFETRCSFIDRSDRGSSLSAVALVDGAGLIEIDHNGRSVSIVSTVTSVLRIVNSIAWPHPFSPP